MPTPSTKKTTTVKAAPKAATPKTAEKAVSKASIAQRVYATGRRKNAIARVWLAPGKGQIKVNGRDIATYFARPTLQMIINQPFGATNTLGSFDILCTVTGGGLSGQAGALRHGISRALDKFNSDSYHKVLRQGDFLTRDSRMVERKKFGRAKARRRFQFSKR